MSATISIQPRPRKVSEALRSRGERADPELVRELTAVLFQADPIGLNFEQNVDEYAAEAASIVARVTDDAERADVRRVVVEEFAHWFGEEYIGLPALDRAAEAVAELLAAR